MSVAVCRIKKLKSWGEIASSEAHTNRIRFTPNADTKIPNVPLIVPEDALDLKTAILAKIGAQKVRKNGVLAVEMLLSASPEFFRPNNAGAAGTQDNQRLDEFAQAVTEWLKQRYKDKVVLAQMHLDEATPHIHAYIVPLDERGKLNCYSLFGNRYKLSQLQDDFAHAIAHLNIERGFKGSRASHTDIKAYYADVNRNTLLLDLAEVLPSPQPKEAAIDYRERTRAILQPQLTIINHQLSDRQRLQKQKKEAQASLKALEKQRQEQLEHIESLKTEIAQLTSLKQQLQDLSLDQVAYELCLNHHERNQYLWQGFQHKITIKQGNLWTADEQHQGNSAIDLVMFIRQCNLRQAVAWLSDRFGESGMLQAMTAHSRIKAQEIAQLETVPKFVLPTPDENQWQQIERYLIKKYLLPEDLIVSLHQKQLISVDKAQNIVFALRSLDNQVTGAILWNATNDEFVGYAPDSKRDAGCFYIRRGSGKNTEISNAVLTSTPIDALSYSVLQPATSRTLYLATENKNQLPLEFLTKCRTVTAAYNNNLNSQKVVQDVGELIPHSQRTKPHLENWNQELITRKKYQEKQLQQRQRSLQMEIER
ncbi:MAG TPA: MobV family relaxase [Oculatellaceae cyanobacterium]|jgi:hypothetical protein